MLAYKVRARQGGRRGNRGKIDPVAMKKRSNSKPGKKGDKSQIVRFIIPKDPTEEDLQAIIDHLKSIRDKYKNNQGGDQNAGKKTD
jgi:hypothetical protein